ncbi:hypothetical protein AVEN_54636-1 [Araneus ventricosus]|uniref:Histone-lysine N-methyltransferase SETMAR n=1 Tax=Araneus ventricosus TaxID=182803 RepID=A0A4Y2BLQ5_ARAVE|nr:hypothetical protein AVEN_54636-1 [Araneus ventricosus]
MRQRHPHQTEIRHSMPEFRFLSRGVLFLDDDAKPHTARDTNEHIFRLGWERFDHPAYSPDLAPPDFHLFPAMKIVQFINTFSDKYCNLRKSYNRNKEKPDCKKRINGFKIQANELFDFSACKSVIDVHFSCKRIPDLYESCIRTNWCLDTKEKAKLKTRLKGKSYTFKREVSKPILAVRDESDTLDEILRRCSYGAGTNDE